MRFLLKFVDGRISSRFVSTTCGFPEIDSGAGDFLGTAPTRRSAGLNVFERFGDLAPQAAVVG
jgi:hypothetical protein